MDERSLKNATAAIAAWYAENRRELPWRQEKDPYRIWISEIMLQQTRIEAVIPYYERFLQELPDVYALAAVPEDRLLKLWEGLGYYSRARNLKRAAEKIISEYGGLMPRTAAELKQLPGIGDYTAGSIASVAFGEPAPAVDGNVMRVMMRLAACSDDVMDPKNRRNITQQLLAVYPEGDQAALLTEGLMELGERVCLPNGAPLCSGCPVADLCEAHRKGEELAYPVRTTKKERRIEHKTVLLLRCGDRFALQKRPDKGILAGLWGFPVIEGALTEEEIAAFFRKERLSYTRIVPCGNAKHVFTHVEWHMTGWMAECRDMTDAFVWVTPYELQSGYSVPTAFQYYKKIVLQNL